MSTRRTAPKAVVVVCLGATLGSACFMSEPSMSNEIAVRRTSEGDIEVASCTDHKITDLSLVAVENPGEESRRDEVLWWIELDPATTVDSVVLGEVPTGANEREPWAPEALVDREDVRFVVRLWENAEETRVQSFELADLDGDTVLFDNEAMTSAEFEASGDCEQGF